MSITNIVPPSPTLAVNERLRRLIEAGRPILHLAFGEAGLPVPDEVLDALRSGGPDNGYGPVAGSKEARAAAAGWFARRGLPTDPDQVVLAPGSKALLWALLSALPGDVVLPAPSWVSYAAQAALAGKRTWSVPIAADGAGGVPDPSALEETLAEAARQGAHPGVLVLTLPDNPTGTVPSAGEVRRTVEIADAHGLQHDLGRDLPRSRARARRVAEPRRVLWARASTFRSASSIATRAKSFAPRSTSTAVRNCARAARRRSTAMSIPHTRPSPPISRCSNRTKKNTWHKPCACATRFSFRISTAVPL